MNHQARSIIDSVRQRALRADQERKALMEQRRELDATIRALTEVTDLSKGEIEKMSRDIQREVYKEQSGHGRKPTLLGAALVLVLSWGLLALVSEPDEASNAAAMPAPMGEKQIGNGAAARTAPALSPSAATPAASAKAAELNLLPGLSEESKVYVFGVHEGTPSEEDVRRVRAQRDAAAAAIRSSASMSGTTSLSAARRRTQIEESPGDVTVELSAADHPVILVLTAYESVHWTIVTAPDARIEHVILSGHKEQFVSGVPRDIPITAFSSITGNRLTFFAYKKRVTRYQRLVNEIEQLTNKPIHQFRGAYKEDTFPADYRKDIVMQKSKQESVPQAAMQEQVDKVVPLSAEEKASGDSVAPPATKQIHKWVDESGRVHYGDKAPASN